MCTLFLKFLKFLKFVLQFNSHFLGELERKSGDNIGNGSGDESITKIEISKSTESKGSFSKAKKVPSFQENSLALKMRAIRTYGTS